jgi:hypothetical protein
MLAKKLLFTIMLLITANTAWARPSIKACWDRVNKDSEYYPMKLDKVTTINGVGCREENGRPIYIYQTQLATKKIIKVTDSTRQEILESVCSNPTLLPLLKAIDMEYTYNNIKGTYLGRITLHIEDCK